MAYSNMVVRPVGYVVPASEWSQIGENFRAGVPDIFEAEGDVAVASAADAATRLAKGASGTILSVIANVLGYFDLSNFIDVAFDYDADQGTRTSAGYGDLTSADPGPAVTVTPPKLGFIIMFVFADIKNSTGAASSVSIDDGGGASDAKAAKVASSSFWTAVKFFYGAYSAGSPTTLTAKYSRNSDTLTAENRGILALAF